MGLLDTLGTVSAEKPKASGKSTRPVIDFAGLAHYAAISTVCKQLEGLLKTHPVRTLALRYFVSEGRRTKKTPQNVDGRELDATASVQLRKRASNQPVDADTVALCADLGVYVEKFVERPNTLRIKPELFAKLKDDQATLDKLIAAGAKALGMHPSEVFEVQTEQAKMLCVDKTLDDLFGLGTNHTDDRIGEILEKVAGATITPKFQGTLAAAFEVARVELAPTPTEMKAREAAAAAAAKAGGGDAAPQAGKADIMGSLKASLAAEGGPMDGDFPASDDLGLPPAGGANRKGGSRKK